MISLDMGRIFTVHISFNNWRCVNFTKSSAFILFLYGACRVQTNCREKASRWAPPLGSLMDFPASSSTRLRILETFSFPLPPIFSSRFTANTFPRSTEMMCFDMDLILTSFDLSSFFFTGVWMRFCKKLYDITFSWRYVVLIASGSTNFYLMFYWHL